MAETTKTSTITKESLFDNREVLLQKLDDFLEQYLNVLDDYEKCRKALAVNMSAGFLSLAQANFTSQSRMRFGQDYYDERMRAFYKVKLSLEDDRPAYCIEHEEVAQSAKQDSNVEKHLSNDQEDTETNSKSSSTESNGDIPSSSRQTKTGPAPDPIRWFGVLVPKDLRIAQVYFKSAVEENIGSLTTVESDLARIAVEIRRTRKQLAKVK